MTSSEAALPGVPKISALAVDGVLHGLPLSSLPSEPTRKLTCFGIHDDRGYITLLISRIIAKEVSRRQLPGWEGARYCLSVNLSIRP